MDVSGHQTLTQVQAVVANPKYGFVIVKATEGQGYRSPQYPDQIGAVRDAGLCAGAYHFAWPNQDPLVEAQNFVTNAALLPGEVACLDVENWDSANPATMTNAPWSVRLDYCLKWLAEVKRLTGATPLVYANWDWIKNLRTAAGVTSATNWAPTAKWTELTSYPLWIADYTTPGAFSTVNGGWPVVMQQWTANDGGLDGDYMPDTAAWATYAKPKGT